MSDLDIVDVDFTNTDLTDIDFTGSSIIADFTGANLKGAKFCGGKISKKSFDTMKLKPKQRHKFMITVHVIEDEELLREDINREPYEMPKIMPKLLRTDVLVL